MWNLINVMVARVKNDWRNLESTGFGWSGWKGGEDNLCTLFIQRRLRWTAEKWQSRPDRLISRPTDLLLLLSFYIFTCTLYLYTYKIMSVFRLACTADPILTGLWLADSLCHKEQLRLISFYTNFTSRCYPRLLS